MKKFWVALIAVALVAGFALSASAADVKFSGSYYVLGATANNWGLGDSDHATTFSAYGQRLRVGTEFKIAEGLTLNTRFDALEGRWGQFGTYGVMDTKPGHTESENISFDRAWLTFAVPYGKVVVGRKNSAAWGTIFGNSDFDSDQIMFISNFGAWEVGVFTEKLYENWQYGSGSGTGYTEADADKDAYHGYFIYKWNGGEGGLKIMYTNDSSKSDEDSGGYKQYYWTFQPYAKAQFGPVFVEAELNYYLGKFRAYEDDGKDRDLNAFNAYVHARADIQNFYVGGLYAFVEGESYDDAKKDGADVTIAGSGGRSWNPTLILWNEYTARWAGQLGYKTGAYNGGGEYPGDSMTNAHLFQIYGGFKPIPKLDIRASVAYAMADEKCNQALGVNAEEYKDSDIGWEVDLTAAYKIYDNLTYTVGFGYLFAGDYWKADSDHNKVDDTYLLMHKLDLVF